MWTVNGEYWTDEQQKGYAALIRRQYLKGTMSETDVFNELLNGFITGAQYEKTIGEYPCPGKHGSDS